jgi:hypothetical protein
MAFISSKNLSFWLCFQCKPDETSQHTAKHRFENDDRQSVVGENFISGLDFYGHEETEFPAHAMSTE